MEYKNPNQKPVPQASPEGKELKKKKAALAVRIILIFILLGAIAGVFLAYTQEIPEVADLRNYKPNLSTAIYDSGNTLISQLYTEQRTMVKIADVPLNLQNAIIAKEDPRFYQHSGFDFKGIIRAAFTNMLHRKVIEGASTITQQLARNIFLTREKTLTRKIKEALLALQIEKYYTKKEILELYCNQIYFGSGAYGVEAAARTYFGKHVNELNLQECAMLAALPQAPSQFTPYKNPDVAKEKRDVVLSRMAERGFITESERDFAIEQPIVLGKLEVKNAPYFVEYVRQQLEAKYGTNLIYNGGLRVQTTLDSALQDKAQKVFNDHIKNIQAKIEKAKGEPLDTPLQGALIAIDPQSGYIKALIGGIDFSQSEFNRAVQSRRQTGSAFKPFVYTAAVDKGFRASDVIMDSPIVFKNDDGTDWKPENFTGKFLGPTILLNGLAFSKNVVTVKVLNKIGIKTVEAYARKLGVTSPMTDDLTLGLGSSSISLLEMVNAFCAFANGGMKVEPLSILTVKDDAGRVLEEYKPQLEEALQESTAYIITYMLENAVNRGTGKVIRRMGYNAPCAGKTGTTNDFSDAWFIGFTPEIVVGIWVGFDTKETLGRNMTGGETAAPIWAEFMMNAYPYASEEFSVPDNIVFKKVCIKSGLLASPACPYPVDAPFISGTEPVKECDIHTAVKVNDFMNQDLEGFDDENAEEAPDAESAPAAKPKAAKTPGEEKEKQKEESEDESSDPLSF